MCPIAGCHEDLLAKEVLRVPGQGTRDLADRSIGHADGEDRRRRGEARVRQEQLVVAAPAGHLDDRPNARKLDVRDVAAVQLEDREPAVGVVQIGDS